MKIVDVSIFEGRNIYSHKKVVRMDLDLEGYCETPSKDIEGFNEKLVKILPELYKHRCGIDEENGFVKRLNEGTYLAHICEHIIIAVQNMLGIDAAYGKSREIEGDRYYIIYQYEYKNTAIEIGKLAVDIINSLIHNREIKFNERYKIIQDTLAKEQLGPSTLAICNEAKKRGIPIIRIGERSMFQLGYGKYGKMIEATIDSDTSGVAVDIACDKLLTKEILFNQCLPVARGGKILNSLDLLLKAESIGYPVVLKPRYGNQGKGVFVNIKNEKELLNAYNILIKNYSDLMIERYIKGRDFRVCIVDGEVIAVAERIPPYIIGDGKSTVRRLINLLNKDERRGKGHEKPLTKVKIDEALIEHIEKYGYNINSIIPLNEKLTLRENCNLSTGGIAVDYTDIICEENIDICKRAAKAIGLNICGIDLCCMDIGIPMEKDGAIIEINAAPGIRMHHYPFEGTSRNVAGAIVDMMFKDSPSSIPLIAVTGTNGKTTTTRLISHVLSLGGHNVGMTTTGGIYINNKCIDKGDTTGYSSAMTILLNKDVDAAVLETARGGIIRQGLAYDAADVAVITNITEDHLGIDGIETMEQLAFVKSLVGEAVKPNGYVVLNADDHMSTTIVERMKSKIIMFSKDKNNENLRNNILSGGIGVYSDEGVIYVEEREKKSPIVKVEDILITLQGNLAYNIENAMAACAGLIGLGVDYELIKQGLMSFRGDDEQNPGRFNMFSVNGATVILDYGHNMEGYKAVLKGAVNLKHSRLVGVIGVPGDRLNSDIREVGSISAKYFDYIYIKEDEDKRGRSNNEVAELLKQGVLSSGFDNEKVEIILEEKDALRAAIDNAESGDVIIIFFEKYEPLLQLVKNYDSEKAKLKENVVMA